MVRTCGVSGSARRPWWGGAVVAVLLMGVGLASCSAKPRWAQKGVSAEATERAWAECQDQAESRVGYLDDASSPFREQDRKVAAERYNRVIDGCMRSQGFFPVR